MRELMNIYGSMAKQEKNFLAAATFLWSFWSVLGASVIILKLLMVRDILTLSYDITRIYMFWLAIIGVIVLKGAALSLANIFAHMAGYAIVGRMRSAIIDRLRGFSLGFFTRERLGNISTIIHHDIDMMEGLIAHLWTRMTSDILVSLVIAAGLFIVDWRMGIALISFLPVAFTLLWIGHKRGAQCHKQNQDNMYAMVSAFVEYTKGIPVLKAFSENPAFFTQLQEKVTAFGASSRKSAQVAAFYVGGYMMLMELCYGVVAAAGAYLVLGGEMGLIVYVVFIILGKEFAKPLTNAELYWVNYIKIRDSFARINSITKHPVLPAPAAPQHPQDYDVRFNNVSFRYQKDDFALQNISFTIEQNTITALVSHSGSGKTTIANLLVRFWDVESGRVEIGGVDIRDMEYDELLSNIGIVMQDVILFNDTIYENIRTGKRNASRGEIIDAAQKAMIHDFIMSLPEGYDTRIGENGAGLSGGQKQRISIARVLLKNAPIVILDEATSAVDPINESKIQQAMSNLARGRALLVIAHHLQTIRNVDQIIVLDEGRIVEKGKHDELLAAQGLYRKLWDAQTEAKGWKFAG